jgi:hypothetical protein
MSAMTEPSSGICQSLRWVQEQHIKLFSLPYLTGDQEVNEAVVNTHFHCIVEVQGLLITWVLSPILISNLFNYSINGTIQKMACELIDSVSVYVGNLQVNFLSKIVGLRPGPDLHKRLANVIAGQDEGADIVVSDEQGHPHNSKAQAPPCNLSTCKFSMCSCVFSGFLGSVNWGIKLKESWTFSSHNKWCSNS